MPPRCCTTTIISLYHFFLCLRLHRAQTSCPLCLPVHLGLGFSAGTRSLQLCPAVPGGAPGAGVPRQVALGLRRSGPAGSKERGLRKDGFHPGNRGKQALSALKLLAASVASAFVPSGGSHAALAGTARGGGRAVGCTPPGRSRGLCLSICNITANRHGRRI